jgi:hypothetical protein
MPVDLRISSSLLPLSLNPLCTRVHPCECGCIHESEAPFPIPPDVFNFSGDGWITFGCLAVFPRHKGKKNISLFFLFVYWVALVINR